MYKLASVALTTVLGVSGIACGTANAQPLVRAEVAVPRVVVEPFAYAPGFYPGYYGHVPYGWRRDYGRDRFEHYRWGYDWHRHWDRR
jgi:hypothetical protein